MTFGSRLNAPSWNAALVDLNAPATDLSAATIHVDLAETWFADFVTLGHLLVFIDMVVAARGKVVVRLPRLEDSTHETQSAAKRQRQRQQCRLFLKQSGFTAALSTAGWPESAVEVVYRQARAVPGERDTETDDEQVEDPRPPRKLRRVLPYLWVSASGEPLSRFPHFGSLETALTGIGLPSETSAAVAKGLLSELISNVGVTEQTKVLVGVCVVAPASYMPQRDDFDVGLHRLLEWADHRVSPLVRVFVGSSGHSSSLDRVVENELFSPERFAASWASPWKVAQIVRSYQGGLIVSSGGRSGGAIFADSLGGEPLQGIETPGLPGSVVECDLLLAPGAEAVHSDHELEAPARTAIQERVSLSCVTVAMQPSIGIDAADLAAVREHLGQLPTTSSLGLVLAVNAEFSGAGPGHSEIMSTLRQVLDVARGTKSKAALVVALPGVNRRLLSLAVDDLFAEETEADGDPIHPVLLVAPENRHYWIGGDSAVRGVLGELSSAGRPCELTELSTFHSAAGPWEAVRRIHEQTVLLHIESGLVRLRVNPEDAVSALTADIAGRIKDAIDSGEHPGVRRGTFLTPSLRITSRWCDVHELLAHTRTEQLAGFALACKVRSMVGIDASAPPSVLRLGTVAREFASAFARSLTGSERYFNSADSLKLERASGTLPRSPRVLIITGLVATEDDLAIALDELVALHITPVAIAAVVDARKDQLSGTYAGEMSFHTSRLPLISLTTVDIEPVGEVADAVVTAIDPLLERPEVADKPMLRTLGDQHSYIKTLKRTSAARLAHIARPADRHYTAYVDPTMLFHDSEWARWFNRRAAAKILGAQNELDDGRGVVKSVCVAYPAETTDNIGDVAQGIAAELRDVHGVWATQVMPIPRAVLGRHWLLPASVSFPVAEHMVVLDSSTGSGRTIQQMLRVAAVRHVRLITCIVLLNGLDDLDALALQQITTIAPPALETTAADRIPVRLHFVARSAVSSFDARDCDVCQLRRAYEDLPLISPLPPKLRLQRKWLLRNLTPRSKRRAFEEEPADLTGMHIGQDECVEYLSWKYHLREAATSTLRRRDIVKKLSRARKDPQQGDALVRLLCAETTWLRSAPLNLTSVRADVAALAIGLVRGDIALSIDPSLRVQALMLLAAVQPYEFIEHFADLLSSNHDHQLVTGQILLEALRLIVGPEAPWRASREGLVQQFIQKLTAIENDMRERSGDHSEDYGLVSLFEIRYLISHARRRLLPIPVDKQSAWAGLRNYRRSVNEHTYQNVMFWLIATFQYLAKGVPADRQTASAGWRKCLDFLVHDVLPNLAPLREILLSSWALSGLTGTDIGRWDDVVKGRGPQKLDEISLRIESVFDSVDPASDTPISVDELIEDLRWWDRFLLTAQVEPGVSDQGAFLTEIVQKCPIRPMTTLEDAFAQADVTWRRSVDNELAPLDAFCTADLLRDVLTHIRMNAESYHRVPGTEQRFEIAVQLTEDAKRIEISICNTGSAPNGGGGGKGLRALSGRLAMFGGDLKRIDDVATPLSYGILVSLERWRMI